MAGTYVLEGTYMYVCLLRDYISSFEGCNKTIETLYGVSLCVLSNIRRRLEIWNHWSGGGGGYGRGPEILPVLLSNNIFVRNRVKKLKMVPGQLVS